MRSATRPMSRVAHPDAEVQAQRPAHLLAQERPQRAPVDATDQLADEMSVQERRLADALAGWPRRLLLGDPATKVVPVEEGLGGRGPVEGDHTG